MFYFTGHRHRSRHGGKTCSSESWWFEIPQGFSCGLEVDIPDFRRPGFVPVDCSEVVVKVAKAKNCRHNLDLGDDCYKSNWT